MHTIELGAKVRDMVSGWTGIATARYEYMNGCERYEISGADKDGKPEGFVVDVQQIEVHDNERDRWIPAVPPTAWAGDPKPADQWEARRLGGGRPSVATGGPRDSRPVVR